MKKPELIYLPDKDGIDLFASEQKVDPRSGAEPSRAETSLEVFSPEPFDAPRRSGALQRTSPASQRSSAVPQRMSVTLERRSRAPIVALASLILLATSFALVISDPATGPASLPVAPSVPQEMASNNAAPPPPPVETPRVVEPPPVVQTPSVIRTPPVEPPVAVAPQDPPRAVPLPPVPTPPRLPRPLSQDPSRLAAGVAVLPPSRASADVPVAPSRPPAVSASPPAAVPAPAPAPTPAPAPASVASSSATPPPVAASTPTPTPPQAAGLPAPATPAPAAAALPAAAAVIDSNRSGVQNAISRYQKAFSGLDVNAAREVWPTVDERSLSRAFDRLEEQEVSFDGCQIDVNDARAEAKCNGTARYVPRVGSRTARVDRRQWRFSLVKVRDEWLIGAVDAR
jgi:hypothetical protein